MMSSSAENAAGKNGDDAPSQKMKLEEAFEQLSVDEHNQDRTLKDESRDLLKLYSIYTKNDAEAVDKHEQNEFDKILFRQPESSHMGDCPICFLPMPLMGGKYKTKSFKCCSKTICDGCWFAQCDQNPPKRGQEHQCPFCRAPVSNDYNCNLERVKKRIKVNDPIAMMRLGNELFNAGEDYKGAFEYYSKAASLGDNIEAHYFLGLMYFEGQGVERDETKAVHHLEQASIGGHPIARIKLAFHELNKAKMDGAAYHLDGAANHLDRAAKHLDRKANHFDRAAKHLVISAKLGCEDVMEAVKQFYSSGFVSQEDLDAAFHGYQAAIDATKSDQREQAAEFRAN